jgi:serine/threonine protein kinase
MAETDPQKLSSEDAVSETRPPGDDDSAAVASAPLTDWAAGQVILDDYVVERELGRGGMGKVYLLRSRSTGQPFAVKRAFLRNENSRSDFLTELQTWIDLPDHPHLVACRFFRTVGDEVVIFAEFVEGGSLADWIRDRRLTGLEQILDAAIPFAWGLHAAHELGLVHQDVKPGAALMTADGQVKVADFGLARDGSRRQSFAGAVNR